MGLRKFCDGPGPFKSCFKSLELYLPLLQHEKTIKVSIKLNDMRLNNLLLLQLIKPFCYLFFWIKKEQLRVHFQCNLTSLKISLRYFFILLLSLFLFYIFIDIDFFDILRCRFFFNLLCIFFIKSLLSKYI